LTESPAAAESAPDFKPFVAPAEQMPELTWPAVVVGAILGIIFGASSLYLVLRTGLTVSASIPIAVLSITLFRLFSKLPGIRRATILENNIVQTTGSAGESIAFGVGVTMPALLMIGFDIEVTRVMTVSVLGGLLGILMMIPLRKAFIVKQHGKLTYPEGTACADVLIAGELGGSSALMVFVGFGVGFIHKLCAQAVHLWKEVVGVNLFSESGRGLRKGVLDAEFSPELLGVGYVIGPRIASIMVGGGVLAYLVFVPAIAFFGEGVTTPIPPGKKAISQMSVSEVRGAYIIYIGAGAVATGGIISMLKALPLIVSSVVTGMRDLRSTRGNGTNGSPTIPRTERDLPMGVVLIGSLALVLALMIVPSLGLGFSPLGLVAALLIVLLGFLFVTVSSRLTGEIGSSSNPISGMTVATLLITCLVFLGLNYVGPIAMLAALTIGSVVCIASSNGGTTSQDLKTGFLVGATPRSQQLSILVGALTSALVIGVTLLVLNSAGNVYTKKDLPKARISNVAEHPQREQVTGPHAKADQNSYRVVNLSVPDEQNKDIPAGIYLADDDGVIHYRKDPVIGGTLKTEDNGEPRQSLFEAPKTILIASIIKGILGGNLPWELVLLGVLVAVTLELAGVASLPFAVGIYLPLEISTPIFLGGALRWVVDRMKHGKAETELSPGMLLASGLIAGGTIAGLFVSLIPLTSEDFQASLRLNNALPAWWNASNWPALVAFGILIAMLVLIGSERFLRRAPEPTPPLDIDERIQRR
jgi:putative OPT family oligopeptide transporter